MNMWLYLKEKNVKCGCKLSDVICIPETRRSIRKDLSSDDNLWDKEAVHHPIATPIRELIFRQNYTQTWLYELENGNPSRKIVEMIFRKASRTEKTIRSVLKVRNSVQSLERFEKYREKLNATAFDRPELLGFYATAMACRAERSKRVSAVCKSFACSVCSILRSNFVVEYRLDSGVQLSSRIEDSADNLGPEKSFESAVIVCRAIGCGSSFCGNESQSGNVIMCNPSAVLACFVIVFN